MALIGRGPGSMSATRRAQRLNRSSICSDPGSSSSSSASATADISNASGAGSSYRQSQEFSPIDHFGSDSGDSSTLVVAEPETGDLAALRKDSDESGSSSPDSLGLPPLFEAHMQYSQSLFAHTAKMWEADRLAIEKSRDQRPKDTNQHSRIRIA
ncbi:hypothetical protein OC845_001335 [Tilletia horrida]|nr:hypothetical protein OC845_001335 [Tilletia horrida]